MMNTKREERICQKVTDQQLLDSKVSEYHMYAIASVMVDWEVLAPYLSLTESDQEEIKNDFQHSYYLQKKEALFRWSLNSYQGSSYQTLSNIFHSQKLTGLAETIEKYPGSEVKPRNIQVLDILYWYLEDSYKCLPHPSSEQWPSRLSALFPTSTQCYYDLILHEAPLSSYSLQGVMVPSRELKTVTLESVSTGTDKLLIYFEGIAGSGKSTLSWHTCREWVEKRILEQFDILIHVHVNDPHIQSATRLRDIIPHHDQVFKKEVATAIRSLKGKGVCFLLDGLDEASPSLLNFLLQDLITGKTGCPKLSFILTSRPNSRVTKHLESILTSRIVIAGFKGEEMNQFLDQILGASSDQRKRLTEAFKINPRLEGLCSLPINAVIMSFIIHFIKDVPTTQTGLYKPLINNFLVRHVETYLPNIEYHSIRNLVDDLPLEIQGTFQKICSLAYSSVLENKYLFTTKEMGHTVVNDMLGFLEVHPRITMFGPERYHSFAHLSLQEFLAAVHLSQMEKCDQISAVEVFLGKNPQSQLLSFYAGLTGLSNTEVFKSITRALSQAVGSETIVTQLIQTSSDPQQKALACLNCLFESENESLLKSPLTDLHINSGTHQGIKDLYSSHCNTSTSSNSQLSLHSLSLHCLPLTPIDCLSLGYYIRTKSYSITRPIIMAFDLNGCSIDHVGVRILFIQLKKDISRDTGACARVQLSLARNKFDKESLPYLKELVQGQSNLEALSLRNCFDPSIVDLHSALKYLIEGLSKHSSCGFIDLSANYFDSTHIHYIIVMLRACRQIYWLELRCYDLSRVMPLFSKAVVLTTLRSLDVSYCNISDSDLVMLGRRIRINWFLKHLCIYDNPITPGGVSKFLQHFVNNFLSLLEFLGLDFSLLNSDHEQILQEINDYRVSLCPPNPPLTLKSFRSTHNFYREAVATEFLEQFRRPT